MPANKFSSVQEVLRLLEQDEETTECLRDSESEDEDIYVSVCDSDNDQDPDYIHPLYDSDEEPSTSSAPLPTTKRKRASLDAPAPGAKKEKRKRGKRRTSPAEEEEDRWHDREEEDIAPGPMKFMPARTPGPTFDTTKAWSPLSLFQLFFSPSVIRLIVDNTNANAARRTAAGMAFRWTPLTPQEFYVFLSIVIYTGLVMLHSRADYWKQQFPYNFVYPSKKMARNRFEVIMWSLHVSNPDEDEEGERKRKRGDHNKLYKIKPLYCELVKACQAHFQPSQNISIAERMVANKSRICFKQYMKVGPTQSGCKLLVLVDSATGYMWNFSVCEGKGQSFTTNTTTTRGLSYGAVMNLMPLRTLGTGYRLYVNKLYTSLALFTDLYKAKVGCCGTIRTTCIGYPQTQVNELPKEAERGDVRWIRRGELLFLNWMDTRRMTVCSTIHQAYSSRTTKRNAKEAKHIPVPNCILDYNRNMGGVDLSNALLGSYTVRHKSPKWYKTFFFHFVDIAVVNSYILHKELSKQKQDPNQKPPLLHKAFREQLMKEMLDFAESPVDTSPAEMASDMCLPSFYEGRGTQTRKHCRRCLNAGQPRVRTGVYCTRCQVPLCLSSKKNCFKLWHSNLSHL